MRIAKDKELRVVSRVRGTMTVLDLEGDFSMMHRRAVEEAIDAANAIPDAHLVFNLDKVAFLDSMAIGLIVLTHQRFKKNHCRVSIVQPQTQVRVALESCNLHTLIPIFASETDALQAAGAAPHPVSVG